LTTTYVYALIDPRLDTLAIRYVGKSVNPAHRLRQHYSYRGYNPHKDRWLDQLQALGIKPVLQVLQECEGNGAWSEVEWIALLRAQGEPLTNLSKGGDGGVGGWSHMTHEKCVAAGKASAAVRTPEQNAYACKCMRAALTQERRSEIGRQWAADVTAAHTPEQRSEIARKRWASITPEQRAARSCKVWETRRRNQQEGTQ
jgi:hypothetical protein